MSAPAIRPTLEADLPPITAIYQQAVREGTELLDRLPRRHPCDAVVLLQLRLGRKPIAGTQVAGVDGGAEVICDLPIRRPIVQPIDTAELHANTSSCPSAP